ncbi:MAG TPA: hypothetical protein VIY28_00820 [Pseudonocardiaceae bacterium]
MTTTGARRPLRTVTLVVAVLALLALVAAGVFGVSWYQTAHDESLTRGMVRDVVLQDAQQATVNLNTLDYRRVQDGLTLWEQSAAGSLRDQVRATRDAYARAVTDTKTNTTASVLDGAVAALDERSGTALVLVGVDVTSQPDHGEATCTRQRIQLEMVREGDSWKVGTLAQVGAAHPVPGGCTAARPQLPETQLPEARLPNPGPPK